MIDAVVDEVLKEMGDAANEGIRAADDYKDTETGLLICGKCHTRRQKRISFLGEERIVCCLCRCATEELEKAGQERKDRETMEGISRLKRGCRTRLSSATHLQTLTEHTLASDMHAVMWSILWN